MLTHKLTERDNWFIKQNRLDSISRTRFQVGHEVVVCSNHHVMLAEFYNGQCNQSGCDSTRLIRFSKKNVQPVLRLKPWKDYKAAFALTAIVSFTLGILVNVPFHAVLGGQGRAEAFSRAAQIKSISVDSQSIALELGESVQLYPQITPEDAEERILTYSSSDPDTAGVSSTGLVTATATANQGQDRQAVVTIEAENGIKTTVDVTVKDSYYAYYADEQIEFETGSHTSHVTPLLFLNTVPSCTGFTARYRVSEVTQGNEGDFAAQEFIIYGRTAESEWQQLGSFVYEGVGTESQLELSFSPRDMEQVVCIMGERVGKSEEKSSWKANFSITGVRFIN